MIRTIARKGIRFVGTATEHERPGAPVEAEHEDRDRCVTDHTRLRPDDAARPPQDAPALSANLILNNLPLRRSSFLGREQDVSNIAELLETTKLVTLIGAGGIGKTSLSLEIAAGILHRFSDGIWFVALAPLADPALVPSAVADALRLTEEPGRPLLSTLLNFLRNKQVLIILDNCEHLVDACARFADSALQVGGSTRILATSREPLGISGELKWRVSSLPAPNPQESMPAADLTEYAAVRLFIERAKFARNSFQITSENAQSVAQICWQLDGIPLAIELAASRVKAMQVEQIVERLGDRFRLLTGGRRTAMPHQQTLLATIDWSYSLLSEAERVLLYRLSVFSGGWTVEAAEAVCAGDAARSFEVLDTLTRLVDKSLVVLDEQPGEPRYRMLETIRHYGREKLLETGCVEDVSNRHLQYYVSVAEFIEPHFYHPDQTEWYAKADRELDNVRGALEWSIKANKVESGLRLINGLHRYWVARVYWMEATSWLRRLLMLADVNNPTSLIAKSLFFAGHIAKYYDLATALRLGEQSLQMSRSLGYEQGVVNALWLLGWCHAPKLDHSAAPYFDESIALARAIDYAWGAVHAYAWYSVYKIGIGDHDAARPLFEASRVEANRLDGDATLLGRCDGNLGLIALLNGDYSAAKAYLDKSLALVMGAGNRNSTAETLWLQGRLALRQRDHARAIDCLIESLKLHQIYSNSVWVTRGLAYLAIAFLACDRAQLAAQLAGALHEEDGVSLSVQSHLGSRDAIAEFESALIQIRKKLAKAEFDAAWTAGRNMTREQVIAFVLKNHNDRSHSQQPVE